MKALTQNRDALNQRRQCATSGTRFGADGAPIGQKGSFQMWRRSPTPVTAAPHQHDGHIPHRLRLACDGECWRRSEECSHCYLNGDTTEYIKETCPNSGTVTRCGLQQEWVGTAGAGLNMPGSRNTGTTAAGTAIASGVNLTRSATAFLLQPSSPLKSGLTLRGPGSVQSTRQLLQQQGIDYARGGRCCEPGRRVAIRASAAAAAAVPASTCSPGTPPAHRLGGMPGQTYARHQHVMATRNACSGYKWQGNCVEGTGWAEYAERLVGTSAKELTGFSVDLSHNGKYLVVSLPGAGAGGEVRVYVRRGSVWEQRGTAIAGIVESVGISDSGDRIVAGYLYANSNTGHAEVYDYNGTDWAQKGTVPLYGVDGTEVPVAAGDYSGYSVAISGDGSSVAVGAPWSGATSGGGKRGSAVTYRWDATTGEWAYYGATLIIGDYVGAALGFAVSLSLDGSRIAVGAPSLANIALTDSGVFTGFFKVFELNSVGFWTPALVALGSRAGDAFGYSVDISRSGAFAAGGSPYASTATLADSGEAKIYKRTGGTTGTWAQAGSTIAGTADYAGIGYVGLSSSGKQLALGGEGLTTNGTVSVYNYQQGEWRALGDPLSNDGGNVSFVAKPVISESKGLVVVGWPWFESEGEAAAGEVLTFRYNRSAAARCCPAKPIRRGCSVPCSRR